MAIKGWYVQTTQPAGISPETKDFEEEILVDLDDPKTSIETIQTDRRYPARFSQHPKHTRYFCISTRLEQDKTIPNVRTLKVQWSTVIPNALLKNGKPVYDDDPLKRPISVSSGFYTTNKTKTMAYAVSVGQDSPPPKLPAYDVKLSPPKPKEKITTTAGEPIFYQEEEEHRIFICQKNVPYLPEFMGKGGKFINSDTVRFQGLEFKPYELLLCNINLSRPKFEFGRVFYCFDYVLMVAADQDGWCQKKRNAGFHEKGIEKVVTVVPSQQGFAPKTVVTYVPYLKGIRIGPIENQTFPSQPVLLTPEGRAYRAPGKGQTPSTPQSQRTGPILTTQGTIGSGVGITDEDWAKSELKIYTRLAIPFARYVPLL